MKVLILERASVIEDASIQFIKEHFPDAQLEILKNIELVDTKELLHCIQECDVIVAQSIFDDTKFFESMVPLYQVLEKKPPVYLIHSLNRLLQAIQDLPTPTIIEIGSMINQGLEVYNVYFEEFENPENNQNSEFFKNSYFRKPNIFVFDVVKLWQHPTGMIWDERPMYIQISKKTYFKFDYRNQPGN